MLKYSARHLNFQIIHPTYLTTLLLVTQNSEQTTLLLKIPLELSTAFRIEWI